VRRLGRPATIGACALAVALVAVAAYSAAGGGRRAEIAAGRALYAAHCASCHGADLEGQPEWQRTLPSVRMPAPPHDASGHTWHHADGVLFRITKEGAAAVVGGGYQSDMPAFGDALNDDEVRAVLAFTKSTWPERERAYQAEASRWESEPADEAGN